MFTTARSVVAGVAIAALLTACNDVTNPTRIASTGSPLFSGSGVDTSLVSGGGGGGGGGGNSQPQTCGTLSTNVQTYNIVVYTTRIGIGFSGSLYNCSPKREAFEVDVVDINPDPYCNVNVPHFIAAKNTAPGMTQFWSANSTLVNCMTTTHTFTVTLRDTNSATVLATTTVSAFL